MLASAAILLVLAGAPEAAPAAAAPAPSRDMAALLKSSPLMELPAPPKPIPGPRTGQDTLAARLPPYPHAPPPDRVGDTMIAHGVPMNIQSFSTPDDPRTVLAFYKQAFETLHLPALGDGDMLVRFPYPSVSAFDDANQVDLHVIAMRDEPNKRTTVILAMADMQGLHDNVVQAIKDRFGPLPEYPGVQAPHLLTSRDGEHQQVMVSFDTRDAPDKVLQYYASTLMKQGFKLAAQSQPGELALVSDQAAWRMVARQDPEKNRTLVTATWSNRSFEEAAP